MRKPSYKLSFHLPSHKYHSIITQQKIFIQLHKGSDRLYYVRRLSSTKPYKKSPDNFKIANATPKQTKLDIQNQRQLRYIISVAVQLNDRQRSGVRHWACVRLVEIRSGKSPISSTFQSPLFTTSKHAIPVSVSLILDAPRCYLHATYVKL